MNRKILTTTLLSMSLLSLNLSAAGQMKCTGGVCMVDLSKISPIVKKQEIKKDANEYPSVLVDNIETIILPHSKYVMTEDEVAEFDLAEMQNYLLAPSLNSEDMPISEHLCSDDSKPVLVAGIENTYECTKS
jgi:hypothetical protein